MGEPQSPPGIVEFIVDRPPTGAQQFYPAPPAPTVFVASPPTAKRKKAGNAVLTALLIVLLVVAILYLFARIRRYPRSLVHTLADRGWILYTRPGCGFCTKQMRALGTNMYPKQVVCVGNASTPIGTLSDGQAPLACKTVKGFPYWINEYTYVSRTGLQSREELKRMARSPSAL